MSIWEIAFERSDPSSIAQSFRWDDASGNFVCFDGLCGGRSFPAVVNPPVLAGHCADSFFEALVIPLGHGLDRIGAIGEFRVGQAQDRHLKVQRFFEA